MFEELFTIAVSPMYSDRLTINNDNTLVIICYCILKLCDCSMSFVDFYIENVGDIETIINEVFNAFRNELYVTRFVLLYFYSSLKESLQFFFI